MPNKSIIVLDHIVSPDISICLFYCCMQQIADYVLEVIAKIKSTHLTSDPQEFHHLFHWLIAF